MAITNKQIAEWLFLDLAGLCGVLHKTPRRAIVALYDTIDFTRENPEARTIFGNTPSLACPLFQLVRNKRIDGAPSTQARPTSKKLDKRAYTEAMKGADDARYQWYTNASYSFQPHAAKAAHQWDTISADRRISICKMVIERLVELL